MAAKNKNAKTTGIHGAGIQFNVFFIFVVMILPLVYFRTAQDASLLPRMMVLSVFLLAYTIYLYALPRGTTFNLSLLKNPAALFGGLYLLISVLSLTSALNRSEGLFDITKTGLTLVIIFYAAYLFSVTPGWFEKLTNLAVLASLVALIIGFYQFFKLVTGNEQERLADGKEIINIVKGLMGNKNEYASYLALLLTLTSFTAFFGKGNWQRGALATTVLALFMLILVATRAAWLAVFMAGASISVIVLILHEKLGISGRHAKIVMIIVSTVVVLGAAGAIEGGRFTHNKYLEKLGSIARPEAGNNHFRLNMWKITAEMSMNHPVTGVGAGNWQIAIPEYYGTIGLKGKEVNWISPHNDYLWILAEKGIIGLGLYLGMIIAAVWMFFRILRSKAEKEIKRQGVFLFAGLIGYLTVACFDFPYQRIDHQVIFAMFLAGMIALHQRSYPGKPFSVNRNFFFIPVILFLGFGVFYNIQALKVETHIKKADALMNLGKFPEALAEIEDARTSMRSLDAKGSPLDYYAGMVYDKMNNNEAALKSYLAALAVHPNHIALLNNLGRCYYTAGYYGLAEHYYLKALHIVPGYKETRVNLSTLYYKKGEYQKSLDMLSGIRGGKKSPDIKQNINALHRILGTPEISPAKEKKLREKQLKKANKKKSGKKHGEGNEN
ncbi:MAG: O-antigen ligase family protein [Bacteroidetes bacterium]|nr:O-antigen ligase family protein [Bacteroidota bacterium]